MVTSILTFTPYTVVEKLAETPITFKYSISKIYSVSILAIGRLSNGMSIQNSLGVPPSDALGNISMSDTFHCPAFIIKLGFMLSSDVALKVKVFFISDLLLPPIKDPKKVPNEFFSDVPDGNAAFT